MKHREIFFISNAGQVAIGDEMLVQGNDELSPARVINISSQTMQGKYIAKSGMSFVVPYNFKINKIVVKVSHQILFVKDFLKRIASLKWYSYFYTCVLHSRKKIEKECS